MTEPFELSEHPADIVLKVRGRTFRELLSNALLGAAAAAGVRRAGRGALREINVRGGSREELLVNFLNEALALSDIYRETYAGVRFLAAGGRRVRAFLEGFRLEGVETQIKGATHHGLEVRKTPRGFVAEIVLDV